MGGISLQATIGVFLKEPDSTNFDLKSIPRDELISKFEISKGVKKMKKKNTYTWYKYII